MMSKILITVFLLKFCYGSINVYYLNDLHASIPTSLNRVKRESDNGTCIEECITAMRDNIKTNMKTANISGNSVNVNLKPGDIPVFCPKVYQPMSNCIQKCPDDKIRYFVTTGFNPLKYMCVDNYEGAKKSFPCAYNVTNGNLTCEKSCNTTTAAPATAHGNTENVNATWITNCNHVKCVIDCQSPVVLSACGQKSVDFLRGMTRTALQSAESIYTKGTGKPLPEECQKFIKSLS